MSFSLFLGDAGMELVDGNRSWNDVFENAAKEWNGNPGVPQIVRINPQADSRPAFGNGINEVYWAEDIVEMDFENDIAAVTLSRNDALEIIEIDIIFNRQVIWNSYRGLVKFDGSLQKVTDLRRVGLHELGHALGLGHPDKADQDILSIMNSQLSDLDRLVTDDKEGVRALYSNFPPERPEQLTILSIGSTAMEVSWEEVSDPEKKNVQYELGIRRSGNGDWLTIGKTEDDRTHIHGLQPEMAYDLRIRSLDSQGAKSAWSEFSQAWVTEAINRSPSPPSDLIVHVTSATSVDIKWTPSADPDGDPLVYEIEIRVQDLENWLTVATLAETSSILNGLQPNTIYDLRIRARDDSGSAGNWTVVLKAWATPMKVVPPTILLEPVDQVSFESRMVIFSAEVQGSEPLSYQWKFNGNPIIGGTSRRLVLDNLNLRDSGRYMLRIANSAGTVSTRLAILHVLKIPGSQSVLFETRFEPEENYDITAALTGQNSWEGTSAAGTGFGDGIFPDNGFQAAIGGTVPENLDVFNGMLLWPRQNVNPVLTGWP
ncbi:MAG TPA: matrixin family metalloprotease, partial [Verrucomicrobia bacterium]|nr:matrixin family metalloprotease [Verrucomicrobiota bacterium]